VTFWDDKSVTPIQQFIYDALMALIATLGYGPLGRDYKEPGVDDAGLLTLYQNYFPCPFDRDTDLRLYKKALAR
jgi:hypothetical protein